MVAKGKPYAKRTLKILENKQSTFRAISMRGAYQHNNNVWFFFNKLHWCEIVGGIG